MVLAWHRGGVLNSNGTKIGRKNASKRMAKTGPRKAAKGFKIGPGRQFPPIHLRLIWLQKATGRQKKIHLAVNHFRPITARGPCLRNLWMNALKGPVLDWERNGLIGPIKKRGF
jgi:hypothetical protein